MKKVAVGIIEKELDSVKLYLLISAKKNFGEFTGYYYPAGGHMEPGETEQETVVREIKEELGLDIETISRIAKTFGDVEDQITYWWLCKAVGGEIKIQEKEILDARWFTEEEIRNEVKIWPATRKVFLKFVFNK